MRVLQLAAEKTVTIYTDSKYAFTTLHVHGAINKERGVIISGGKDMKYGLEILELLEAVWGSQNVTAMHCPGHQKDKSVVALGNWRADWEAYTAALQASPTLHVALTVALLPTPLAECVPHYSSHECEWFTQEKKNIAKGDGISLQMDK
jgi:ribonuclease HI